MVQEKWVDIGNKKSDGSFSKCGRSKQWWMQNEKVSKMCPTCKSKTMTKGKDVRVP